MGLQYHIHAQEGDIAPYVLLPGDPGRVEVIASGWDSFHKVASNREYTTYTGVYKGMPISCTSTGIGAPSTAIAMEELARIGATTFLRVGTCSTFQDEIEVGDICIIDSAMRFDGTSRLYAPIEYPAVANYQVLNACISAAETLEIPHHVGVARSTDSFYVFRPQPGMAFNDFWQSGWEHFFADLKRLGVHSSEMETGIVLVLAKIWGLRAGSMAVVMSNAFGMVGRKKEFSPQASADQSVENINRLSALGSESLCKLYQQDQEK